ncbi:hypothetical protein [Blattabacterium cuenoti]|uniref:hypothetical protein n=1 Tax=Blattabacterium cuenoti TaxID=1653831 RepID=UPI001EEA74B6|nr:hypothetical protein [Blattabacterium cuenoti]
MKGLKIWLEHIKNPKLQLTKNQIAYYYFLNGIFYSNKNIFQSENYMNKALDSGLKFNQNIIIAKLNLVIASLSKGDKRNAKILLMEVKKMDKNKLFQNQIQIIKMQMKKINLGINNMQNPFIRNKY